MAGEQNLEWLPHDWTVKKRKRCGRKRTWYIEPKYGLKFSTKPQVLRYLSEVVDSQQPQQQREEEQDMVSTERTVADNLPAGWAKGIQRRRSSRKKDRSPTETEGKISNENKGDEGLAEGKAAESGPSPGNNGAETSRQPNELQDISIDDYQIESWLDFLANGPKEDIQLDKSEETPAAGSSFSLPPDDFLNIPWFLPAYKLITDEIPLETYIQQTSTGHSVLGQG